MRLSLLSSTAALLTVLGAMVECSPVLQGAEQRPTLVQRQTSLLPSFTNANPAVFTTFPSVTDSSTPLPSSLDANAPPTGLNSASIASAFSNSADGATDFNIPGITNTLVISGAGYNNPAERSSSTSSSSASASASGGSNGAARSGPMLLLGESAGAAVFLTAIAGSALSVLLSL